MAGFVQQYTANVGGALTYVTAVPGLTPGVDSVTAGALEVFWNHQRKAKDTTILALNQDDVNGNTLASGQSYRARIYALPSTGETATVAAVKGTRGTSPSLPAAPAGSLTIGNATVSYGGAIVATVTMGAGPTNWTGLRSLGATWLKGIVHRDYVAPDAGARYLDITIPSSEAAVVSGLARVGYGYPLAFEFTTDEEIGTGSPYAAADSAEVLTRADHDMAHVYPARLAIEYAPGHVNLDGPPITSPAESVILSDSDGFGVTDVRANVLQFPSGDIGLQPSPAALIARRRIRPAPAEPLAVVVEQATPTTPWPDEGNAWTAIVSAVLSPWLEHATTITRTSGAWTHTRNVPCVLWQYKSGEADTYDEDPTAKLGTLGEPSGAACPITFTGGGGAQAPKGAGYTPTVSILGDVWPETSYGWTFTADGIESALSPLTVPAKPSPLPATYSRRLTIPLGPTGTTERAVYRYAHDLYEGPPNQWGSNTRLVGPVYDQMMRRIISIPDNVTTEAFDADTSLVLSGDRPPGAFISVGPAVTINSPLGAYALAPLNL